MELITSALNLQLRLEFLESVYQKSRMIEVTCALERTPDT